MQSIAFVIAVFEFVLLVFSLSFHECAHAWMASRLGDQTARMQGRITLNPSYHIDPIGTLLIPAMMILLSTFGAGSYLIGWAKPTPVNTRNFRNLVRDDNLVTLAGPLSNLLLAFIGFLGMATIIIATRNVPAQPDALNSGINALWVLCRLAIQVNLALCIFNLLPIPPLDGSHIVRHFLPYNALKTYDSMGMFSYILMIVVGGPVVGILLGPAMNLILFALGRIQGS